MSQDFGSQRLQQFPGREEATKCPLPTPESSENNANAMLWATTSACCMTLRHLYADIFKSRSLRGVETRKDIRKHEVAMERKRDWRHSWREVLHAAWVQPLSMQPPGNPHQGRDTLQSRLKKQEDVKSRAVCVGLLLKEMRGKYIRNIFVSEHEGKIYS